MIVLLNGSKVLRLVALINMIVLLVNGSKVLTLHEVNYHKNQRGLPKSHGRSVLMRDESFHIWGGGGNQRTFPRGPTFPSPAVVAASHSSWISQFSPLQCLFPALCVYHSALSICVSHPACILCLCLHLRLQSLGHYCLYVLLLSCHLIPSTLVHFFCCFFIKCFN